MMKRFFFFVLASFWFGMSMAKPNLDSLYHCLDDAIQQSSAYMKVREGRIADLQKKLKAATTPRSKYQCCFRLYQEYSAYKNDSAIVYLDKCIVLAHESGEAALENNAKTLLAYQNSTTGDYVESYSILSRVDTTQMDAEGYRNYLWASEHLYGELSYYCKVPYLKAFYEKKMQELKASILRTFPHNDDRYLQILEVESREAKDYERALAYNDQRMGMVKEGTHEYAIVTFYRAVIYKKMEDRESAMHYFLQSALCDVRLAVMDQGSLWELANLLNLDSQNFDHSYSYIKFAWNAANIFNTAVRSRQIMPVLSTVEETYQTKITENNRLLKGLIAMSGLLLLVVLGLLLYVNKQRHRLALAHKNLELSNAQLEQANKDLAQSNGDLKKLNDDLQEAYGSLNESNKMKEVYIGRFLRLCAVYVDKIEAMRKRVAKLVKAREFNQLHTMLQADHEYINELYDYFDSAFLKLFPDFVAEFNALLKPEERVVLDDDTKLTTTIRIFALIRLGIEDSSKIAEFLHYSVNTIYNYRAKTKNAALCNRDEFEEKIKQIGMK